MINNVSRGQIRLFFTFKIVRRLFMGKLFEKLRIFISLIFVPIFLLGIFSCSESAEKSSSVSFKIPSELVENIRGGYLHGR